MGLFYGIGNKNSHRSSHGDKLSSTMVMAISNNKKDYSLQSQPLSEANNDDKDDSIRSYDITNKDKTNDCSRRSSIRSTNRFLQRLSGSIQDHSSNNHHNNNSNSSNTYHARGGGGAGAAASNSPELPITLEHLPDLILDLESAVETSAQRPIKALKRLFTMSEHVDGGYIHPTNLDSNHQRIAMVHYPHPPPTISSSSSSSSTGPSTDYQKHQHHQYHHDDSQSSRNVTDTTTTTLRHGYHRDDGRLLVPTLFQFLKRCQPHTNEQYLTLLVLNNISIPFPNKRIIALDHGGVKLLAQLLCQDPSCHLLAIILVNLTYCSLDLRKQLLEDTITSSKKHNHYKSNKENNHHLNNNHVHHMDDTMKEEDTNHEPIALVESLAFALRIATLTKDEYEERAAIIELHGDDDGQETTVSTADRLAILMAEDQRLRMTSAKTTSSSSLYGATLYSQQKKPRLYHPTTSIMTPIMTPPSDQLYPETTRWCLSALRNLTRPCKTPQAAHILIRSYTYSLILQFITIAATNTSSSSFNHPKEVFENPPYTWDANSMQDLALSIVMNLAACSSSREYTNEVHTIKVLKQITQYPTNHHHHASIHNHDGTNRQMIFQALKARMTLSYLLGSQGHFGQSKLRPSASTVQENDENSMLIMSETDIDLLLELLDNTLHRRGKEGPGGYSSSTFSLKYILLALRCLLTHTSNQFAICNRRITVLCFNTLLMKALAIAFWDPSTDLVDAECAEYAVFCLYLHSNYGLEENLTFLPAVTLDDTMDDDNNNNCHNLADLCTRILIAYLIGPKLRPAGKHAAEQLLLRWKFLNFDTGRDATRIDVDWDAEMVAKLGEIDIDSIPLVCGDKPCGDIFHRPILRSRKPRNGVESKAPWNNNLAAISIFPSALHAVQQLSYGSTKVRHADAIDDIKIANQIAASANGERTESYNFLWTWEDKATEIQRNLERQTSIEGTGSNLFSRFSRSGGGVGESTSSSEQDRRATQSSFLRLNCAMCAADTTVS